MKYKVKIILEFEEKPTSKDIVKYVNELDENIDYEIETSEKGESNAKLD